MRQVLGKVFGQHRLLCPPAAHAGQIAPEQPGAGVDGLAATLQYTTATRPFKEWLVDPSSECQLKTLQAPTLHGPPGTRLPGTVCAYHIAMFQQNHVLG